MRVAIVDDDSSVRNALRRLLTTSDFVADAFASGEEFLAALPEQAPDCAVVDLKMPEVGGLELLRALADRSDKVPVIIMTAFDTPKSRADCETLGAVAYLRKPFEEVALLTAIDAAVKVSHVAPEAEGDVTDAALSSSQLKALHRPNT
jgi:FixJ family two-component response regulator